MKRGYDKVETGPTAGGHAVRLDGKVAKTPGRRELVLPSAALAAAIAAEWQRQGDTLRPHTMPLTRLAATAIDRVADQRAKITGEAARYAETDLLCYRAEHPPALAARQHAAWQPLLDWAARQYDAPLATTCGIVPKDQAPASLHALAAAVAALDDFRLAVVHAAAHACGSLVIALALVDGQLDGAAAFAAAELDESFQIEAWGLDDEAAARREALALDIAAMARFVALLRGE